ncbi:MAG: hypothetical protein NMK33_05670 [Candidatus Cardinium sp.]|uniref:hypothetical protein n=1 Tax=Cardinium endosymbiont of Dermatophagoides farinae TaxID=2597823 RepID=UPI001182628B|nr:hypothetical protein [Cardinium endosymbiont of Dermatophagoides farinae]TSJ80894.1 hypothetical protein FPG78_02465 [Cardinium endosymbiont of Dermatophagoides farinae]UWW96906.1 MAG: hypothetical protein NMK33_05670 [Candidatus Cardinium sp.]
MLTNNFTIRHAVVVFLLSTLSSCSVGNKLGLKPCQDKKNHPSGPEMGWDPSDCSHLTKPDTLKKSEVAIKTMLESEDLNNNSCYTNIKTGLKTGLCKVCTKLITCANWKNHGKDLLRYCIKGSASLDCASFVYFIIHKFIKVEGIETKPIIKNVVLLIGATVGSMLASKLTDSKRNSGHPDNPSGPEPGWDLSDCSHLTEPDALNKLEVATKTMLESEDLNNNSWYTKTGLLKTCTNCISHGKCILYCITENLPIGAVALAGGHIGSYLYILNNIDMNNIEEEKQALALNPTPNIITWIAKHTAQYTGAALGAAVANKIANSIQDIFFRKSKEKVDLNSSLESIEVAGT